MIVELGVDINAMVPGTGLDRSVLHNAAGWGGLELVRLLLELGADPNLCDPTYHAKPIGWAVHNHQRDVIEYLLRFADIFDAVNAGGIDRVRELLDRDPSLAHARNADGVPLAFYLHPETPRLGEMVALLAAHGADFGARTPDGRTPVDRALARGWIELADLLREAGSGTAPD